MLNFPQIGNIVPDLWEILFYNLTIKGFCVGIFVPLRGGGLGCAGKQAPRLRSIAAGEGKWRVLSAVSGDAELEVGAFYLHDVAAGEPLAVFVCNADFFGGIQRVENAGIVSGDRRGGGDVVYRGLFSGRETFGGYFFAGDNGFERDADEADAAAAVFAVVVAGFVEDAHMVIICHGNARVAHALAHIVQVALVPGVTVVVGGTDSHVVAATALGVGEEQEAAVLLGVNRYHGALAGGLLQGREVGAVRLPGFAEVLGDVNHALAAAVLVAAVNHDRAV